MRGIYPIALFIFLFQVSAGITNGMNVFPLYQLNQSAGYDSEVQKYTAENNTYITSGVSVSAAQTYGFGDYVWSMLRFIGLIVGQIASVRGMLLALGIDPVLALSVHLVVYFIYAVAIIGFVRGPDPKWY